MDNLKKIEIENLNEKNRDLKNSRRNMTLGIIVIIVAVWTIIASLVSPLLNRLILLVILLVCS